MSFCSIASPEDSIKVEVKKSKFAIVMGMGLVGGTRLGIRYNLNNYISAELSYSPLNIETLIIAEPYAQLGSIINYKPFNRYGFTISGNISYYRQLKGNSRGYVIAQNIGYFINYNEKGFGGFIRVGRGFFYNDFNNYFFNFDLGLVYNF